MANSVCLTPQSKGDPSPGKKYSPAQPWRGRKIYVGSASAAKELNRLFQETGLRLEVCFSEAILWGRDARVERLDGSHLIPFQLYIDYYPTRDRFYAMVPIEEVELVNGTHSDWGRGFTRKYREEAVAFAKDEAIPFQAGKTCIEGGNCRIFIDGQGRPKALVGVHSVLLTILAMEQQGYFEEYAEELARISDAIEEPEEDSYRVAKNLLLCRDKVDRCDQHSEAYRSPAFKLLAPLEPEKKAKYKSAAANFEAKRVMAINRIADELGIPARHIAVLFQENFHIDLDVLPGPDGIVFLHDEELAIRALIARRDKNLPHERELIEGYLKNSHERVRRCREKCRKNAEAIDRIGCRAIGVAGDFIGAKGEERVNFMNGILFNDRRKPRIYTNGTDAIGFNLYLKGLFVDAVESVTPQTQVIFVHDQTDRLQRRLGIAVGGLHCLTYIGGISEPPFASAASEEQSVPVLPPVEVVQADSEAVQQQESLPALPPLEVVQPVSEAAPQPRQESPAPNSPLLEQQRPPAVGSIFQSAALPVVEEEQGAPQEEADVRSSISSIDLKKFLNELPDEIPKAN